MTVSDEVLNSLTMKYCLKYLPLLFIACALSPSLLAATHTVDLTMRYETVTLGEKPVRAITVNGQIPAPELRFTEGDDLIINLHNELDEPGSIHWHGLLVPYKMDGVPWVSMPPVMPGETFQYRFNLQQSGTYWYHSHSKFHEQRGLYGAFIVEPKKEPLAYDREMTLMLSDWADRNPDETYRNLKMDGDYYKQFHPSWKFFWDEYRKADEAGKKQVRETIAHMQQMRMGVWDWGDVAYDAFLLNGKTPNQPWTEQVVQGETVRLRIINGGASSYFNLRIDGAEYFTVVAADGQPVEPVKAQRLLMGMAETYDILLKIDEDKPYYVYAESQDRTGHGIATLKTRPDQADSAELPAFNDPWFTEEHNHHDMAGMDQDHDMAKMDHSQHSGHDMSSMAMTTHVPEAVIKLDYNHLRATYESHRQQEPAIDITLRLTGNMERYIWSFDNVRFEDAEPILFEEGKTYKLTLINDTMMHHPIHIHGHWFVMDTGNGNHNPRKHTIDVPPMGKRVAWIKAEANGKWLFHCHNLYHMKAGMTRLINYHNMVEDEE